MRGLVRWGLVGVTVALSFTAARVVWACAIDADCSATPSLPVCNTGTAMCVACQSDYSTGSPGPFMCSNPVFPACNTSGPLAGQCTQCSPSNPTQCNPENLPVCQPSGWCGCATDSDCTQSKKCESTLPPAGFCSP